MALPQLYQALCTNESMSAMLRMPQHRGSTLGQIETELNLKFPGRVDVVIYSKSSTPGWSEIPNNKGIIAILIGQVLSPRDSASGLPTGKRQHKPFLKPTGAMGITAVDDWESPSFTYQKIEWLR